MSYYDKINKYCLHKYILLTEVSSVSDPDPRIRFRDDGSGSGSDLKSNKFQFVSS